MTSVGFQNPISGSYKITPVPNKPTLGGGLPGFIPQAISDTNNYNEYAQTRFTLRNAWNTTYPSQLRRNGWKRIVTPFRAVNNAGDLLCREYYSCGGGCQSFQSRPGLFGLRGHFGRTQSVCDVTQVPPSTCNGRYVYDSSDYITFVKNKAVNKNYNDLSYGGDRSNASQSAYKMALGY